jgi:type I restriction enzyme M protein
MVALKGKPDIGDQINKKIIAPLANANKLADMPDFNDADKLGSGKEMVDRLTNLIAIFENKALDFSKNRAEGDDILGDAYEYLMRHFATEAARARASSTPRPKSAASWPDHRHRRRQTSNDTTVYDPTCGSGSLLLKVGDEATAQGHALRPGEGCRHQRPGAHEHDPARQPRRLIMQGNTLADPKFKDGERSRPSTTWSPIRRSATSAGAPASIRCTIPYDRFKTFGVPPAKQGDYAYLLHIVRSLKSTGKGACILPHGVLFRGNAEADIRRNLVKRGYIKGIIGLPANLFYGTGIPACIVVIDKEDAQARKGIFMIDASAGFMKDGPKNRLREQDIHKIVDVFTRQDDSDPKYARMVGVDEIEKNDFNLNLPRYIDSQQAEDMQDIEGHLKGGIPAADVDACSATGMSAPAQRQALFKPIAPATCRPRRGESRDQGHHLRAPRVQGLHCRHERPLRRLARAKRRGAQSPEAGLSSQATDRANVREPARPLHRPAAARPLRHLPAPDGLLGRDHAGRLLPDRRRRLEGRDLPRHREEQEGQGEGQGLGLRPACPSPTSSPATSPRSRPPSSSLSAELEATAARLTELEEEHGGEEGAFAGFDKVNSRQRQGAHQGSRR